MYVLKKEQQTLGCLCGKLTLRLLARSNKNHKNKTQFMAKVKERTIDIDDEIVNKLPSKQKEITQNLRELIKTTIPETVETLKQQNIVYKFGKNDFVWINNFQGHVDLEFAMGSSLASDMLKSRGIAEKSRNARHIEISEFNKVKPEIVRLLKDAASVGFSRCKTT